MHLNDMIPEQRKEFQEKTKANQEREIAEFVANYGKYASVVKNIPKVYRLLWVRAFKGEIRGQRLLKLKCLDCSAWKKEDVKNCPVRTCPLWNERPYQEK